MQIAYITNLAPNAVASMLRIQGMTDSLTIGGHQVEMLSVAKSGASEEGAFGNLRRGLWMDLKARDALERGAADAILVYGTSPGLLRAAYQHSRMLDVPVFLDVVEWYLGSQMRGGRFGPWAIANSDSMHRLSTKCDGVIAISSFLAQHYRSHGVPTLVVPPLFSPSIRQSRERSEDQGRLDLCFAGSLGARKDGSSLSNTIAALTHIKTSRAISLHVIGPTRDEVTRASQAGCVPPNVHVHGRLSRSEVLLMVSRCHFTILQRRNSSVNVRAGFPSKVAESLVLGTPVISNVTSDLGSYLLDGYNAIILSDDSQGAMIKGLRRALTEPLTWDRSQIQTHADAAFAPAAHALVLSDFLTSHNPSDRRPPG